MSLGRGGDFRLDFDHNCKGSEEIGTHRAGGAEAGR